MEDLPNPHILRQLKLISNRTDPVDKLERANQFWHKLTSLGSRRAQTEDFGEEKLNPKKWLSVRGERLPRQFKSGNAAGEQRP